MHSQDLLRPECREEVGGIRVSEISVLSGLVDINVAMKCVCMQNRMETLSEK